ncbi:plexin-A2-like [Acanthaster planci]|uniref:Hepatocyte growth factor receptor n=1 Tax=Acanthaster planci TaxID=133434 RepID=A0A8B7Z4I8_ACAPL|nr:plexin-A2-like [Acanthaster planci]
MSSIVTAIELNHTVAFIGTSSGDLLKVHLDNNVTGRVYERVAVDSSPVLRDIKLDNQTDQLYLLTEQKLLKLRVENCSQYTTCDDCIGTAAGQDGDPYCGWCSLERKCTRYSACHLPDLSTRWLAYDAEQCLEIIDVENSLPLSMTEKKISLIVQQLPDLCPGQSYECHFGSYVSMAVKTGNVLACTTPPVDEIPSVKQDEDATTVQLSIYSTETAINFVDVPFHFYECSSHTSCVSCVGSNWTCDWCVFEKRCTHDNSSCMRADEVVITGDNNPRMSSTKGPGFCPQLQAQEGEVLIPVGVKSSITFQTANLPNPAQIFSYACRLRVEGGDMVANARRLNDTVTCEERTYSYTGEEREVDTFLVLEWVDLSNQRHVVNDVHGYIVTLYDCSIIGPDCSRCVTANSELYCLWCGSTCTFDAQCDLSAEITLPHNGHNCPDPVLTGVNPRSGPIEGNTVIAVFGTDLGRRFEDIDTVMVGNQPCDVAGFASLYSTGGSISCLTPPGSEGPALVTLSITGANGTLQSSMGTVTFAYTDPQISNFVPIVGPEAGGTVVTISGFNLQTGNTIEAYFGNSQCVIVSVQDDSLQCRTSPSTAGNADVLRLSFDGAHRTSTSRFSFVSNPQITKVSPLASIQAGGRNLSVTGKDFNIIQTLKIVVYCPANNSLLQFEEQCRRNSDTSLTCPSPDIRPYRCNAGTFGFIMDSVTELLTWSERNDVTLEYFPDPVYFPFDGEGYDVMAIGYLMKIHGKGIDSAVTAKEIVVTVGSERCEVSVIGDNILVCKLPKIQPTSLDGSYYPAAVVHHGNLIFNLGKVIYGHRADLIAILVPSVIIPLSMAILLAACLMYCRQMRRKRNFEQQLMERLLEFHHAISSANKQILDGSEGRTCTLPTSKQKRIVLNRRISFVPSDVLIDYTRLEFGKTLGQGAFGRVLRAVLHNTEQEDNIVAVKTVQDTSDSKLVMKFLEEGLIMKRFDHVNVMGLLGLTFDPDDNPMLVLPFMANGDLKTFMIRKKKPLPTSLLLRFASHVALGMAYLA